jgi:ribosome-associated toxin RatA of RatAB toxin-antitoxin module
MDHLRARLEQAVDQRQVRDFPSARASERARSGHDCRDHAFSRARRPAMAATWSISSVEFTLARMFPLEVVAASKGPLVEIALDREHRPVGATVAARLNAPASRVWEVIADVASYTTLIPMIHKVHREGDRVTVKLRFRISLFSVGFEFTADATYDDGRTLELRWVAGEPRELRIRFDLQPAGEATIVHAFIGFDVRSLGWLAKYFLKHHPEIEMGVFPGSALTLLDSLRRAVEAR